MKIENTIYSVLLQYYGGQNAHLFRKGCCSSEFGFAASFWHHAATFMQA
jgi:hypothetical protein